MKRKVPATELDDAFECIPLDESDFVRLQDRTGAMLPTCAVRVVNYERGDEGEHAGDRYKLLGVEQVVKRYGVDVIRQFFASSGWRHIQRPDLRKWGPGVEVSVSLNVVPLGAQARGSRYFNAFVHGWAFGANWRRKEWAEATVVAGVFDTFNIARCSTPGWIPVDDVRRFTVVLHGRGDVAESPNNMRFYPEDYRKPSYMALMVTNATFRRVHIALLLMHSGEIGTGTLSSVDAALTSAGWTPPENLRYILVEAIKRVDDTAQ